MRAIRYWLNYTKHFLVSNGRHGTHSPFVYRLVDEVIYAEQPAFHQLIQKHPSKKLSISERLFLKLLVHFSPRTVLVDGDLPAVIKDIVSELIPRPSIFKQAKLSAHGIGKFGLAFIQYQGDGRVLGTLVESLLRQVDEDSIIMVSNIYRDDVVKDVWRTLKENPLVTVSLDLFHVGVVFFRPGQAKEDFKIRL